MNKDTSSNMVNQWQPKQGQPKRNPKEDIILTDK